MNGNCTSDSELYCSFFECRTEILTKRMTNGRDVYRGVNALQAKINLIERYGRGAALRYHCPGTENSSELEN